MVMEYFEQDLKASMDSLSDPYSQAEVKCLLRQLLLAVEHMHRQWFIHRDLKSSNLLLGANGKLSVCDFGLARKYGSPLRDFTQTVVTLWYRAPELLLGATRYGPAIDMWSVGCILAECLLKKPLFMGKGEVDQLDQIFRVLGAPTEDKWPGYRDLPLARTVKWKQQPHSKLRERFPPHAFGKNTTSLSNEGFDLLSRLLHLDPAQRLTAAEALDHAFFREVTDSA